MYQNQNLSATSTSKHVNGPNSSPQFNKDQNRNKISF